MTTKTKDEVLKQEPAAWITPDGEGFRIRFSSPTSEAPLGWDALYTAPPSEQPEQEQPLTIPKSKPTSLRQLVELMSERFLVGQTGDGHEIVCVPPSVWSSTKKCVLDLDTNWQALTTPKPQQEKHSAL